MKYWRTMMIALALGAVGLAVWADDCIRGEKRCDANPAVAAVKPPTSDPAKDEVLPFPPATAAPEPAESEPPARVLELVGSPPVAPPVVPPPSFDKPLPADLPKASEPPLANDPPPLPKSAFDLPPLPRAAELKPVDLPKPLSVVDLPSPPMPAPRAEIAIAPPPPPIPAPANLAPMPSSLTPPAPPPAIVMETRPASKPVPTTPVSRTSTPGTYKVSVRMGGTAGPRFEVRDGDSLLLKVYCEKIELQGAQDGSTALPGLTASGRVRVSGSGLNGTCDSLTIASGKGEVQLKGSVKLTCYRGNASSQIVAESMTFQLKGAAEVPVKSHTSSPMVGWSRWAMQN